MRVLPRGGPVLCTSSSHLDLAINRRTSRKKMILKYRRIEFDRDSAMLAHGIKRSVVVADEAQHIRTCLRYCNVDRDVRKIDAGANLVIKNVLLC